MIAEQAGHKTLAATMNYVDHNEYGLERLEAERKNEAKRKESASNGAD